MLGKLKEILRLMILGSTKKEGMSILTASEKHIFRFYLETISE